MCVVSMVYDHFEKRVPQVDPIPFVINQTSPSMQAELDELRELIREFREAVQAARLVDVLTKQPDCEDPQKAKLEERVARLEKKLAALGEP